MWPTIRYTPAFSAALMIHWPSSKRSCDRLFEKDVLAVFGGCQRGSQVLTLGRDNTDNIEVAAGAEFGRVRVALADPVSGRNLSQPFLPVIADGYQFHIGKSPISSDVKFSKTAHTDDAGSKLAQWIRPGRNCQ